MGRQRIANQISRIFLVYRYGAVLFLLLGRVCASSQWDANNVPPTLRQPESTENLQSGTSTTAASATTTHYRQTQRAQFVPLMKADDVALSLRLTCDINRRLQNGSWGCRHAETEICGQPESHHIPAPSTKPEQLTIFHSSSRDAPKNGSVLRKDLNSFVRQLTDDILMLSSHEEKSMVLSLGMIYLDRASSVETLRSNGVPPCPFCTERTVHRLFLASLLTAFQVVAGDKQSLEHCYDQVVEFGWSSRTELINMLYEMRYALGDLGYFVGLEEGQKFKHMWERVFLDGGSGNLHASKVEPLASVSGGAAEKASRFFAQTSMPHAQQQAQETSPTTTASNNAALPQSFNSKKFSVHAS